MARPYYAEYVKHAMRYYAKSMANAMSEKPRFKSEADKKNWSACQSALNTFTETERNALVTIYAGGDTIPDNVYQISHDLSISQDELWNLINAMEKKVAKRRGLI